MSDDGSAPSRLARLLFGGAIVALAGGNFQDIEGSVEYAKANDVPMADVLVPFASGMATVGALGVVLWRLPTLAAGAVATFLVGITPTMHDFWSVDDEGERERQRLHFLKNVGLLAAALAFVDHARSSDDGGGGGDADGSDDDAGGALDEAGDALADAEVDLDLTDDADGVESVTAD